VDVITISGVAQWSYFN